MPATGKTATGKTALIVGVGAIAALVVALWALHEHKAPDFPAIPKPPAAASRPGAGVPSASATAAGRNAAAPPSGQPAGATEAGTTDAPAATGATPSSKQDASNAAGAARLKADLETLHKAAIANPKDPRRWTDLARAYTMAGQPRLATAAMRRATNLERRTAMAERVNEAQRVKSVRTGKPRPRTGDPAALPPVPVRRATP